MTQEDIKNLNEINVSTQKVKLGEMLNTLISDNKYLKEKIDKPKEKEEEKKILSVKKSTASTIKELVADYNDLISKLKESGYIK